MFFENIPNVYYKIGVALERKLIFFLCVGCVIPNETVMAWVC